MLEKVQAVNMEYILFILQVISNSSNNHKLAQYYILHKWSQPEPTEWTLYKHSIPFLMSPVIRDERERKSGVPPISCSIQNGQILKLPKV